MALIEKIRNRQGLLMIMIGLGMIGFLIPYDAVMSMLGQGGNRAVGTVDGNSISAMEYQSALQRRKSLFNYQNNQALETEVWNDMVERTLLSSEYRALGLEVVQEEFDEVRFGEHISPWVQRTFYGAGINDEARDNWRQNFASMFNDVNGGGRANYNGYTEVIVQKRLREKYDNLINKGVYANSLEAKYEYLRGEEKVDIQYVLKKYTEIADSLVRVNDSEVRALYNKRKNDPKLKQLDGRDIEYIQFTVEPSKGDIERTRQEMDMLVEEWQTLDNDSNFVIEKGRTGSYIAQTLKETEVVSEQDQKIFDVEPGTIVGPYEESGVIIAVKPVSFESVPDSTVKCRHILLSFKNQGDADEVKTLNARADSLRKRLRAGDSFDELALRHSEDPGSKNNGGVYDFFPRGQMVAPFEKFCFENRPGTVGAVETTYGIHLIEVLDQRWSVRQAELAVIARQITPSADTRRDVYNTARDFALNFNDIESFRTAADTMGYALTEAKNIRPGAAAVGALRDAFEVVNWAYKSNRGEVSAPMTVGESYVVALLTKVMDAGPPPFENIEDQMREEATKQAKAKKYMELLKAANNLEEAAEIAESQVRTARAVTLKSGTISGSGVGQEPKVAGLAFAIPNGSMSLPIQGEHGMWIIAPSSDISVPADRDDYFTEQDQVTSRMRGGLSTRLFNKMKDGNVQDDRSQLN